MYYSLIFFIKSKFIKYFQALDITLSACDKGQNIFKDNP